MILLGTEVRLSGLCFSKCLLTTATFLTSIAMEQIGHTVSPGAVSVLAHGTCLMLTLRPALKQQDGCTEVAYQECLMNCVQQLVGGG